MWPPFRSCSEDSKSQRSDESKSDDSWSQSSEDETQTPDVEESSVDMIELVDEGNIDEIGEHVKANPRLVHKRDDYQETALHRAAQRGKVDVTELLIKYGADVNAQNTYGNTMPLHLAAGNGFTQVSQLLLESGAKIDARSEIGFTALHYASRDGYLDTVQLLLSCGAAVDARSDEQWTPLHLASSNGYAEIAMLIVQHGADINADIDTHEKTNALALALSRGNVAVAKFLIECGFNMNANIDHRPTPLYCALQGGCADGIGLLIQRGAEINTVDEESDFSPLNLAAFQYSTNNMCGSFLFSSAGHIERVKLLLQGSAANLLLV